MRDKLVLALVTDSHHRVGRRERVLKTGVAGTSGTATEPRSVQTIHRRSTLPLDFSTDVDFSRLN